MRVVDSWNNALGERVELSEDGNLRVRRGALTVQRSGRIEPAGTSAPRCGGQRGAPPPVPARQTAVAEQIAAYEAEVRQHPGLVVSVNSETGEVASAFLQPVPYFAPTQR